MREGPLRAELSLFSPFEAKTEYKHPGWCLEVGRGRGEGVVPCACTMSHATRGFGSTQNTGLLTFAFLTPLLGGEGSGNGELLWGPETQYCPQAAQTSVLLGRAGDGRGAQGLTTPTPIGSYLT